MVAPLLYRDGMNADRYGSDHVREVRTVRAGESLDMEMAAGGGWVARLEPVDG